ncbi:hypothetical protein [Streptomyces sp. JW3]|uniref:hypothetical protein n=1 Tax=Streptomyces sp. JW3 TaxID=3456955 RepID=UPI003FA42C78
MMRRHIVGLVVEYAVQTLLRSRYGPLCLVLLVAAATLLLLRPLLRQVHPLWWLALGLLVLTAQA